MKSSFDFNYKKATQAVNFFAQKEGGKIEKLKTLKLAYLADRLHLRKFGRPIFNDRYWAMRLGPVASSVADIASFNSLADEEKEYSARFIAKDGTHDIVSVAEPELNVFSDSERQVFESIYTAFGHQRASQLVNYTHKFPEWSKFKLSLESGTSREPMDYMDFFDNPDAPDDFFSVPAEELGAVKDLFSERAELEKNWVK